MEKKDPVSSSVKKERAAILRQIFEEKKQKFIKTLEGTITQVIVEEKNSDGSWVATSSNFQTVRLKGDLKRGELVTVRLELTDSGNVEGTQVVN
jgi:tRNA A37 methylthiotransferase MiaB